LGSGSGPFELELDTATGEFHPHLHVEGLPQAVVNGRPVEDGTECAGQLEKVRSLP
jgi:hypothetical protein